MFNKKSEKKNQYMLTGSFARQGYDWWWHSFTGINVETGEEKPFFIEYFLCNPKRGGAEPIFGQLPENQLKHKKPSYLMVKAGTWGKGKKQLHRFFGWDDVNVIKGTPYEVWAEDCYASDIQLKGSVSVSKKDAKDHPEYMCDAGEMSWDLKLDKKVAFNVGYGAGGFFRAIKAFEMYWHAEGMKTLYSGTIELDGVKYKVSPNTSYGYADKNWGRNFTSPWVWISSNNMKSKLTGKKLEDSVFDIGGGCPKVYFVPLSRKLLSAFWYEGKCYEYNFSKFWTGCKTEFSFDESSKSEVIWHVRQENKNSVMETEMHCKKKDMLFVNYESPDGKKRHNKLWNGGNGFGNVKLYKKTKNGLELIDDIEVKNAGVEYGEYCEPEA